MLYELLCFEGKLGLFRAVHDGKKVNRRDKFALNELDFAKMTVL